MTIQFCHSLVAFGFFSERFCGLFCITAPVFYLFLSGDIFNSIKQARNWFLKAHSQRLCNTISRYLPIPTCLLFFINSFSNKTSNLSHSHYLLCSNFLPTHIGTTMYFNSKKVLLQVGINKSGRYLVQNRHLYITHLNSFQVRYRVWIGHKSIYIHLPVEVYLHARSVLIFSFNGLKLFTLCSNRIEEYVDVFVMRFPVYFSAFCFFFIRWLQCVGRNKNFLSGFSLFYYG